MILLFQPVWDFFSGISKTAASQNGYQKSKSPEVPLLAE
jgi:hypothetical protein